MKDIPWRSGRSAIGNQRVIEGWDGYIRTKAGYLSEGASIDDPMVAHDLLLKEEDPLVLAFLVDLVEGPI